MENIGVIMKKNIGIKVISNACGVLPHSIRTWETRYQVFTPDRTEGGQRLYSEDDLARAKLLSVLINEGHSISQIAKLDIDEMQSMVKQNPSPIDRSRLGVNKAITNLFNCLTTYNIEGVVDEMRHLRLSLGSKDFIFQVILPVMQEIGIKVANGVYSVTQEHIVSTIVRDQMGQIAIPNLGDSNRKIALATPNGNLHELSILIADIICRSNRVPTCYLGASHPAECLSEAVNALKVNTIVMGVVSSDSWDYEKNIVNYLTKLDKNLKNKVTVVLGGGWEMDFPSFTNIEKIEVMTSFETFDESLMNYTLAV